MFEKYNKLFELYLRGCKSEYDSEKPYENLEECCETCNQMRHKLLGMIDLMQYSGEITDVQRAIESKRIIDEFSTLKLFNATMLLGEVMVYKQR